MRGTKRPAAPPPPHLGKAGGLGWRAQVLPRDVDSSQERQLWGSEGLVRPGDLFRVIRDLLVGWDLPVAAL